MPLFLSVSNEITVYSLITPQGLFAFSTKQHHAQIKLLVISVIISLAHLVCKHYFYAEVVVYRRESWSMYQFHQGQANPTWINCWHHMH